MRVISAGELRSVLHYRMLIERLRQAFRAHAAKEISDADFRAAQDAAIPSLFRDAKIVQAEQIEDAGLLGAAALALQNA